MLHSVETVSIRRASGLGQPCGTARGWEKRKKRSARRTLGPGGARTNRKERFVAARFGV
jgi:hypothetical protein